jgi:hypothetical protein
MTTLQKSLAFSVLALVLGAGIYEATLFAHRHSELSALTRHESDLNALLAACRT